MLGFFKGKAAAADTPVTAERAFAPGTELPYDSGLIANFKADHQTLFKRYDTMLEAAAKGDAEETAKRLKQVSTILHDHLLKENVRLYAYLAHCITDEGDKELVSQMRGEMSRIGRSITHFIRHYTDFPVTAGTVAEFTRQANDIRHALEDRMQREESTLYTLYLPPSAY